MHLVKHLTHPRALYLSAVLSCALAAPICQAAANIVANPGFENGFTSWTLGGNTGASATEAGAGVGGTTGAYFGPVGSLGTLTQVLSTAAGQSYDLSFYLRNRTGEPTNLFQVSWGGSVLTTLTNSSAFPYTLFSFENLTATSALTALTFGFRHDADFWFLDDVSVTQRTNPGNTVPDGGSTISSLAATLLLFAGTRRVFRRT